MTHSSNLYKEAAEQALPYMQKSLKTEAYQQTIKRVAQDLNRRDRRFSQIIHAPFLETPSNFLAHTLLRPSGILGGGLLSLLGTLTLLYLSRFHAVQYSFSAYFIFFGAGFLLGLIVEGLLKMKN